MVLLPLKIRSSAWLCRYVVMELRGTQAMPEETIERKTLWMLEYDYEDCRHLKPFYGTSREDAESQARQWMKQLPYQVVYVGMRAYPRGFVVQFGHGLQGSK